MDCRVGLRPPRKDGRIIVSAICNDKKENRHPSAVFARSEATWQSMALTPVEWRYGLPRRPFGPPRKDGMKSGAYAAHHCVCHVR